MDWNNRDFRLPSSIMAKNILTVDISLSLALPCPTLPSYEVCNIHMFKINHVAPDSVLVPYSFGNCLIAGC